ncbi:MAG: hypothetical protein Q8R70_08835 [Methanoregula sp.]|nr:hypothetical protein [Methanoregula sp.]
MPQHSGLFFLVRQGEFFLFSLMFALIAGLNPVFVFPDVKNSQKMRGWIFFYLMVLVALFWATFLMVPGVLLWMSLLLFIVVSGMCIYSLAMEEPGPMAASSPGYSFFLKENTRKTQGHE